MEFPSEDGSVYIPYPEVEKYLEDRDTNPDDILVVPHIPRLIGGIKSADFAIRDYDHTDDAPPASLEVDVSTITLSNETAGSFFSLFEAAESQADEQYDIALLETRQKLADMTERGGQVDTLFIPGSINGSASGYFRRLQRLAQDTDLTVVALVNSSEGTIHYEVFNPIRTDDIDAYWDARAHMVSAPLLNISAEVEPDDFSAANALGISEVSHDEFDRSRWRQHDVVRQNIRSMSQASAHALFQWVCSEDGLLHAALPEIRKIAFDTTIQSADAINERRAARNVLAKIGDTQCLQVIMKEVVKRIGSAGSESETIAPLSLYVRRDPVLAPFFAKHLTNIPDTGRVAYGQTILHAATRWMPDYANALHNTSASADHDAALATLLEAAVFFVDAYIDGRLEGARQSMTFGPQYVGDMLLSFGDPAYEQPLRRLVLAMFKEGGSILSDNTFERLYVGYRKRYGDLPEISRLFQPRR